MTSCVLILLCALTIIFQVNDVTSWSFSPPSVPLLQTKHKDNSVSVTFTCQAATPLDKCQVNMYEKNHTYDFVDLNRGRNSGVISRYHHDVISYNVSYYGTGLENGQCGAVYSMAESMASHYGCRGANAAGEWQDMDLVSVPFGFPPPVPASITPLRAIAKPGSDVTILLHSKPMWHCVMLKTAYRRPHINFLEDNDNWWTIRQYSYRSIEAGPWREDCGVTLLNVTEDNNGPISIQGMRPDAMLVSVVIIASPPSEVSFKVDKISYSVGDTLNATCSSLLSRPVANLTWTLDGKIIRQDAKIDHGGQDNVWSWSWEKQNITQILSLKLGEEDFGKKLACHVQHLDTYFNKGRYYKILLNI